MQADTMVRMSLMIFLFEPCPTYLVLQPEDQLMDLVTVAAESLPSIAYHLSPDFISGCLQLSSLM
jgi:hypothetical protein